MTTTRRFLALALLLVAPSCLVTAAKDSTSGKGSVTPLQKVIGMLNDMLAKGKAEKHDEEVTFAETMEWCNGLRAEKEKLIEQETATIAERTADASEANSEAEVLAEEIADLDAKILADEKELADATAVREKENADFKAAEQDFSESIDAIGRAIGVLKQRTADVPQSLIQVRDSRIIPAQAKAAIESFLSMRIGSEEGAPEANAYEFQSGGVVAMLEKLLDKFNTQLLDLQKKEMVSRAAYETLAQQLTDDIKYDKSQVSAKTALKAQRLDDAAKAKADVAATEKAKAEDETILDETNAECHAKSVEYEKNQVLRAEEVKVIIQATEILSTDTVSGAADTYLPASLSQTGAKGSTTALAQLRSSPQTDPERRQRVAAYLQESAKRLNNEYLAVVANHAVSDPFAKVKTMIKDLIVKLMEEANDEADKKAYCDTELATNKQTRDIKTTEVEDLTNKIEELTALSTQLGETFTELSDAIAALKAQQAEATTIRSAEKKENTKTIADAKAAQIAVEKATQVLKDFYAKAAGASLVQAGSGLMAEMRTVAQAPYKGMQSESGGIIGFLEVVLSDFARLESETSMAEDEQTRQYDSFMAESTQDIAVKETDMKHKENKKQETDDAIRSSKKELALTQDELDSALDYYDKLKADCVTKKIDYAERKQAREEEIASLQEALKMLSSEDLGF